LVLGLVFMEVANDGSKLLLRWRRSHPLAAPLGAAAAGGSVNADYRQWLVTVRTDETHTRDYPVRAHSAWAAGAQLRQLHPSARIIAIRLQHR